MERKSGLRKKLALRSTNNRDALVFIDTVRKGIEYEQFDEFVSKSPFSLNDWSRFLNISFRTIQRYKKENKRFDPIYSEKILEIILVYQKGIDLFGNADKFDTWLNTKSLALGGIKPVMLLDTTFGINMLGNELNRIEHGILA